MKSLEKSSLLYNLKPKKDIIFEDVNKSEEIKMRRFFFLNNGLHKWFDWLIETIDINLIMWYVEVTGYVCI